MSTSGLEGFGDNGPGEEVTVYVKTTGDSEEEHTMIEILGRFFMAGGGENPNSNGAPCEFKQSPSYMAEFHVTRHPAGL
jgi:hypothetical protein